MFSDDIYSFSALNAGSGCAARVTLQKKTGR
jgi:hypothetical protein